ncbi:MAG TPA: VOC family protein [Steroidobacteraceae bacterium]|jgi:catechol 2,3-dioxygenase-like lactoylglutathione lyase family enzyme|nr:VOC family protein [Steroidobacteraceae bacterium]
MFGQLLELSIATDDIAASVEFYERLGFSQLTTNDALEHRYGVLSDGRLHLGLHECAMASPAVTFVRPDVSGAMPQLANAGIEPHATDFGENSLHRAEFRDPGGYPVALLEARTYSPAENRHSLESLCGYFAFLSLPERDFSAARIFWEHAGFVSMAEEDDPFPHQPLTSDHLDLAFHSRRTFDAPLLVFESENIAVTIARLRAIGVAPSDELPRGLDPARHALIEAPEGTALLLIPAPGDGV